MEDRGRARGGGGDREEGAQEGGGGRSHFLHLRLRVLALGGAEAGDALDGKVVGLGCPAGEYDLFWIGANQFCDVLSGHIYCLFTFPAISMGS